MASITVTEAQAWAEKTKLDLGAALDGELEAAVSTQVLAQASQAFDTSTWLTPDTTPKLIRTVISMMYVSWFYQRAYSEDASASTYGALLESRANTILQGVVDRAIGLVEIPDVSNGAVAFYPTDISSAVTDPSLISADGSLGPAKFTMGQVF